MLQVFIEVRITYSSQHDQLPAVFLCLCRLAIHAAGNLRQHEGPSTRNMHVSFIFNNGKLSPRRATALVALEMIDPKKKNPFNCTSKKDVW